jgi:hypothetical protein
VDANKPFVHVFDEASLQIVMAEIDTAPDFIQYLKRRRALLTNPDRTVDATGEEEMLARYLTRLDAAGKHDFLSATEGATVGHVVFGEGNWWYYVNSPERRRKDEANAVSYRWDFLIKHLIEHLQAPEAGSEMALMHEQVLRIMAAENRFSRRGLARQLHGVIERSRALRPRMYCARVGLVDEKSETAYVFLIAAPDPSEPDENNSSFLNNMLMNYCQVLCIERPEVKKIVGIGMFAPDSPRSRESVCLTLNVDLPEEFKAQAREMQQKYRILIDSRNRVESDPQQEYPDDVPKEQ